MKKSLLIFLGISLSISLFANGSKTVFVSSPGTLYPLFTAHEIDSISNLTITGTIDARDFVILRDSLQLLDSLDLSGATIEAFNGTGGTTSDVETYLANEIPNSAFSGHKRFKSIILPTTTTSISDYAFYYCDSLTSFTIPSTVTTIGYGSFESCSRLRSIVIPPSVTDLGPYAFYYCDSLASVSLSPLLTHISKSTFEDCRKLSQITIPSSIKVIGENAFSDCYALSSVTIPSSVDSILQNAFYDCLGLRSITVPSTVKYIGESVFSYCRSLQSFDLPTSISAISNSLFNYCDSLKSINIPSNIKTIGESAFYDCISLKTINIPTSVDTIGESAFDYCSSLQSVTIPSSVTYIGGYAFEGCDSLQSVSLPSTITSIKYRTFYYCKRLKTINIPSSVLSIGISAFEGCDSLHTLTLPASLKYIDKYAFYNCTGLESINLPNAIDSIGYNAFQYDTLKVLIAFTGPNINDYDKLTGDSIYIPQGTLNDYLNSNHYDFKVYKEFEACVASVDLITIPGQGIKPDISFTSDTVVCPGQTVTIKAPKAASYLWSTKETSQSITVSATGTYSLTAVNTNGCISTGQELVTIHQPYADQIKIATFNKTGDAIIIAWTPTKGGQIAGYALQLLDDATGKFKTIAKRGIADSTFVVDSKANALIQTYSYQLISYDSICHDSAISTTHETIHLSCSQSTNASNIVELSWNTYKGLIPEVYNIYTYNAGTVVDTIHLANNGNPFFSYSYNKHQTGYTYRIGFDLKNPVYTGTLKSDS